MTFIKFYGQDGWFEWDKEKMKAYNLRGGFFYIDENSPKFSNAECREFESWHEMYKATGYNPLLSDAYERDAWLSPEGDFYDGEAHEVEADYICELLFGEIEEAFSGDYLIQRGWVKLSACLMMQIYIENGMYKNLTQSQIDAIFDWCRNNGLEKYYKEMIGDE